MGRLSATLKFSRDVHESPKAGVAAIGHCRTTLLAIVERRLPLHGLRQRAYLRRLLPQKFAVGKPFVD